VSDDTDKAAREWAALKLTSPRSRRYRHILEIGFKAGASHALSRPLSEGEEDALLVHVNALFDGRENDKQLPTLKLVREIYSALQRMRTKG
jgi:hypothetical protein